MEENEESVLRRDKLCANNCENISFVRGLCDTETKKRALLILYAHYDHVMKKVCPHKQNPTAGKSNTFEWISMLM